jgi:limonene-1,2-epoxide hydrolase
MWETDGFEPAFERYMHPDALWQNTGFPDARGRTAYMALLRQYGEFSQMPYGRAELISIAVNGKVVLTERIDHLYNKDRTRTHSAAIMGAFVVENGLIRRYSDYFDAGQFTAMMNSAVR